jgi:hypothetical protein
LGRGLPFGNPWSKGQAIDIKERGLIVHLLKAGMTPKDIPLAHTSR